MPVEEKVEEVEVAEVPEVKEEPKVETPDPKKFKREIQPKDKDGKAVGSPHVYYGSTEQELIEHMAEGIANGTLKIRELTLKEKAANTKPPDDAELEAPIPESKAKELTADERFAIAEKIRNPETVVEGYQELHKATTGRTPEEEAAAKTRTEKNAAIAATRAAAVSFMDANPEYFSTKKNGELMGQYLAARGMPSTSVKNYEIAFRELSVDGLLEMAPPAPEIPVKEEVKQEPEVKVEPVVAEVPPRTEAPVKRERSAFPSSLSRDQASGTGAAKPKKPTAAEVAMMDADQYKAHLEGQGLWGK